MFKILPTMLLFLTPWAIANSSFPHDDVALNISSISKNFADSEVVLAKNEKPKSKIMYVRRTLPFLFSGSAAVIELTLQISRTTNPDAILAANVLWLAANVAGLGNIYLDFRAK